jgi:MFS family permease
VRASRPKAARFQAFRAFRNHNYRLFWIAQVVSVTGTWMQRIAQAWLVLQLTDSPLALGTIATVQFLPILVFSLFGGVFADRLPKLKVLSVTQSVMAGQALLFAVLTSAGFINLPEVYVLAAILGIASALDQPTRQAFLVEMVGSDDLPNAVALNSVQFNVARIGGPALGGLAIAAIGVSGCLYLNAASFLAVIAAIAMMRQSEFFEVPQRIQGRVLSQLTEGVSYALKTPDIALIIIVLGIVGTFGYNFTVVLPLIAKYSLDAGPGGFGLLTSVMGVGSVFAGVGVAFGKSPSRARLFIGGTGFTALLFALAFCTSWWSAVPVVMALGVFSIVFQTTASTRLQLLAPREMRGRIMSIYQLLFAGTTPIGGAVYGLLADRGGVSWATGVMAVLCGFGVLAGLIYLRAGSLRRPPGPAADVREAPDGGIAAG